MDQVTAEAFLLDQVTLAQRSLIPQTLRTAYDTAKLMVAQEPVLNVASAVDNRGRLISWAVDHAFEQLPKTERWPFDFSWRDFAQPTGRYLEIRPSHSVITVSQVDNPDRQPRNVVFRANARLNNEPFFDLEEFKEERATHGLPHFLMIHGHQSLDFAHLAVPHAVNLRKWIYRTPNLMNMPHVLSSDMPEPEPTDFEAVMVLKEEIEKWRHDHGV